MTQSARWRAKAMTFIDLARTSEVLGTKRRYLMLATSCMRYSVRLAVVAAA